MDRDHILDSGLLESDKTLGEYVEVYDKTAYESNG